MLESIRKWLIRNLIKPEDIKDYISNVGDLDKPHLKISLAELKKTDAAKKVLLSKGISIVESKIKELQQKQVAGHDVRSWINQKQRQLRMYHEQLDLIDYRARKEELEEVQLQEALATEAKRWREQILTGDIDSFFEEALEQTKDSRKLENGLYNRSGQFYNLLEQKNQNLITTDSFELSRIDLQLSFLSFIDRIQARRMI